MSVVKLTKKEDLDKLIATITLRLGRKIQQQEIIDACIHLGEIHINELLEKFSDNTHFSKEKIKEILELAEDFDFDTKRTIDQDLYE